LNNILKIASKTLLISSFIFLTTACGESAYDDTIDKLDKKYSADINYINAVNNSSTFYAKSNLYLRDVYHGDFEVVKLLAAGVSGSITHKWSSHGHKFEFATEDTNSGANTTDVRFDLTNQANYWAVAWLNNNNDTLSIFQKKTSSVSGVFSVRIFANANLTVKILGNATNFTNTVAGQVSETYTVESCADLYVGGNEIDLCQQANFGQSYLVVVDSDGLITYAKE